MKNSQKSNSRVFEIAKIQGVQDQNFRIQTVGKAKMCLKNYTFFLSILSLLHITNTKNMKNEVNFQSCLHGLVDNLQSWTMII